MAQLKIDNQIVQLGKAKLVFSKSGYSFENWLTKDIPYSERVSLPETSILNSIFSRPFASEIHAQKFSKFHTFNYIDNGKIVFSGICKLLSFTENREYEIQLIDGSFDLFENLKNKLNKLDFESSDFTFNASAYTSLKVLNSSAWIWSASSMHESKILSKNILSGNLAFSRPFFSVKRLIEKMLSVNGWTYELSTNASMFDKFVISANSKFVFTSFEKSFSGTLAASTFNISSPLFLKTDTITGTTILNINKKSKIRFRGSANAANDFILQINGTGVKPQTQTFPLNKGLAYYDITSNNFEPNTALSFSLIGIGNVIFSDFKIYTSIDENNFGNITAYNFDGFKVKTYDNLPNIVQKDLLKHCLVLIGGFFTTDFFRKKLKIESVNSLSKLSVIDWSEKFIEESGNISLLEGYAKINYFSYNNDGTLGRGIFEIDNEILKDSGEVYSSIFAASQEVVITDNMIDNTVYNDTELLNDINTLIGYYENISTYSVARFQNLNGNNILSLYYSNFVKAIQKGELIEAKFNLNKSDFFLFDFSKLVYIAQKKSIFYVLNIGNYIENELTDVTLLKY